MPQRPPQWMPAVTRTRHSPPFQNTTPEPPPEPRHWKPPICPAPPADYATAPASLLPPSPRWRQPAAPATHAADEYPTPPLQQCCAHRSTNPATPATPTAPLPEQKPQITPIRTGLLSALKAPPAAPAKPATRPPPPAHCRQTRPP